MAISLISRRAPLPTFQGSPPLHRAYLIPRLIQSKPRHQLVGHIFQECWMQSFLALWRISHGREMHWNHWFFSTGSESLSIEKWSFSILVFNWDISSLRLPLGKWISLENPFEGWFTINIYKLYAIFPVFNKTKKKEKTMVYTWFVQKNKYVTSYT